MEKYNNYDKVLNAIVDKKSQATEEEKQLLDDEYQNRLAWGIYNGILDYFYN